MRAPDVRHFVQEQPFQPFRITLTDGRTYDVMHPEFAVVGRSSVLIGLPRSGDAEPEYDRQVTVSLLHIMQIEAIPSAPISTNGTQGNGQ